MGVFIKKEDKMRIRILSFLMISIFSVSTYAQKQITLEDIWSKGTFSARYIRSGISMNDGIHYTILEKRNQINVYDYETGVLKNTLFSGELFKDAEGRAIGVDDYTLSDNEDMILISTDYEPIYRHSGKSEYWVFDIKANTMERLSEKGKQQLAIFSPSGNEVAFARDNNLFIKDLVSGIETQITNDGLLNHIINGTTDWVYEEEFGFTQAFFWSPDGKKLAFYRFDESEVKQFTMMMYNELYPEEYRFKYPKAGEANSKVSILVYHVDNGKTTKVDIGENADIYIPRIKWSKKKDQLAVLRLNRHQNHLEIILADAEKGTGRLIYEEKNACYIEIGENLLFLDNGNQFILSSEKSGYNHLYLCSTEKKEEKQITQGNWEVTDFYGYDEKGKTIYYASTESSPINRDIYSIKLDGKKKTRLNALDGTNTAQFSKGFKFFINTYSGSNTPPVYTIYNSKGKEVKVLEDNKALVEKVKEYGFSEKKMFSFKTGEGEELNGWMIKPADFDSTKKYPVFMYVYGGPGSQTVLNRWDRSDFIWHQMLAQNGYIVVSVDNRGTGGRGEAFKKVTYLELGKYEAIDQIESAKYLGSLPYVDASRIGIFGWSFGGYLSSLCILKGADVFKAAIAVAPVTSWRYYDNIYTERYMRTPQENAKGYDENSPINHVSKLKGSYLLVHGTADDNVHYQNAIEMTNALINENKQFEQMFYPNRNHGIYGGNSRIHLYKLMTGFILENL